jgi:hypothetical protein
MNLTQDLTFKLHYPKATPLLWQAHNSCAWTPTGTLSFGEMEITPKKVKLNEQLCYDEYFESAFKAWLQWGQNPQIGMTQVGIEATNALADSIIKNATLGARVSMVAGELFDLGTTPEEPDTPTRIIEAFSKTSNSVKGWIQLAIDTAAAGESHLNDSTLITAGNISTDGTTYTGATKTVVELYDENLAAAKAPLRNAVVEGGVGGFGFDFYPLWIISPSIYNALDLEWKAQKESATINEPRISVMEMPTQTSRGTRNIRVFMIDNTVVIPAREASAYHQYLTGTAHFCYLTISGCIQLGSSFSRIPVAGENDVSVMVQQSTDAEDLGTFKFLSHALMGAAINDTDYLAGHYSYAEPA